MLKGVSPKLVCIGWETNINLFPSKCAQDSSVKLAKNLVNAFSKTIVRNNFIIFFKKIDHCVCNNFEEEIVFVWTKLNDVLACPSLKLERTMWKKNSTFQSFWYLTVSLKELTGPDREIPKLQVWRLKTRGLLRTPNAQRPTPVHTSEFFRWQSSLVYILITPCSQSPWRAQVRQQVEEWQNCQLGTLVVWEAGPVRL